MLKKITAISALVLAAGLIAAGCGDDDEDTTSAATTTGATGATGATGGEALSESEFSKQGNEICREANKAIDAGEGQSESQEDFATGTLVPAVEDAHSEFQQLTPPEADADTYDEFLTEIQDTIDEIKSDPSSLGPDSFADVDKLAKQLGLTECVG